MDPTPSPILDPTQAAFIMGPVIITAAVRDRVSGASGKVLPSRPGPVYPIARALIVRRARPLAFRRKSP